MKELKFRVWDIEGEFMHCPSEFDQCGYMQECADTYVIMQYIGFADKAGIPIFEGDILEVAGGSRITVESLESFLIYCGQYLEKNGVPLFPCVTIVGNKYESKE